MYFGLIADVGATRASAVSYVVPLFAVAVSIVVLDEPLSFNQIVGGVVVLIGIGYAENRIIRGRSQILTR